MYKTYVIPGREKGNAWHALTLDQTGWHLEDYFYDAENIYDIE